MSFAEQGKRPLSPWAAGLLLLGLTLSFHGYDCRDGDQAYRLPILLHGQAPAIYARDPFVRAFDTFNPHRGYLALLDAASRPLGLSAGLFGLYATTFALTFAGIGRLAQSVWPGSGPAIGPVAMGLVLLARAGNIGTNHLFGPMLLDRLLALGFGWCALALAVNRPERGAWASALLLGVAAWVHPTLGLQLGLLLGVSWIACGIRPRRTGVRPRVALAGVAALALGLVPAMATMAGQNRRLFEGMAPDEFRLWTAYVQSPQHMVPHLWRWPQWLAWACYPVLAVLTLSGRGQPHPEDPGGWPVARVRLAVVFGVNLMGLGLAWVAVEPVGDLRAVLFQPFRMATVLRGLALVVLAGRALSLWCRGDWFNRGRAALLAVGLTGDWSLVVATLVELAATVGGAFNGRWERRAGLVTLAAGLAYLARHDTASGHLPLLGATAGVVALTAPRGRRPRAWHPARPARALALAWAVPLVALVLPLLPRAWTEQARPWVERLARHCRFGEVPVGDQERLALWCRSHTRPDARFVVPPGAKTFRLWSRRDVAFNRAASPYHAAALADWAARFRDHVGFRGTSLGFARAYLADRLGLERRYDEMAPAELAALACRQGAEFVIAPAPRERTATPRGGEPLELLRIEGRFAVYRVRPGSGHRVPAEQALPPSLSREEGARAEGQDRSEAGTRSAGTG